MNTAIPTLDGYQLRLPTFEGALDVLLGLIERERLEISDLSLVSVTNGFLAYIDCLVDAPPALLAEFAGIAARLLLLKSRALLPRPPLDEIEPDIDDLATRLREYQRAKLAAERLREAEQRSWRSFARPPAVDAPSPRVVFVVPPVAQLRRALARSLARARIEPTLAPLRRIVSIGEMVARMRAALAGAHAPLSFRALVPEDDRHETIAGFIALLALWRRDEVTITQSALFGDMLVSANGVALDGVALDA